VTSAEPLAAEIDLEIRRRPDARTAELRALRRTWTRRLAKASGEEVLAIARRVLNGRSEAHRFVAYELVAHHRAARQALTPQDVEDLGRALDSWGAVDAFAVYVAGPAWRAGQVPDRLVHAWARSEDRWRRRAALVATVALNTAARGGAGDTPRTLAVCRLLVRDRDDMVVKALSWALRELGKRDAAAVGVFLAEHDDALPARVKREVGHKLATGLKSPRRRPG
jgi:3-methyladenine DNA glycosylase AlkD